MWHKKREKKNNSEVKFPFLTDDDGPVTIDEAELENELISILGDDASGGQTNGSRPREATHRVHSKPLLKDISSDAGIVGVSLGVLHLSLIEPTLNFAYLLSYCP